MDSHHRANIRQTVEHSKRLGVEFLLAELQLGNTLMDVAERHGTVHGQSAARRAREAHDAVLRLLALLQESDTGQWLAVEEQLVALETRIDEFANACLT